ncbi:MAG: flagellar basal body P-ring formation chaperone FlgA [Porticoccaceae bacterium]|nr:flagellar basal body P-ring formation chaperone FlgA [Porticoccaceae bacterium]MDG1307803.1 flagellar basal body P-ring formation chaperone FlgA [Porticoccaceae bacterium]
MPPKRQTFADIHCRSVGIASPRHVAHTRAMSNLIFLILGVLLSPFIGAQDQALSVNKQLFIEQAERWVADQAEVNQEQVAIAAMDRRFKIPDCANSFVFTFPYASSNQTLRAQCVDSGWQAFVGVSIHREITGYAFIYDMNEGDSPTQNDLRSIVVSRPAKDLIQSLQALENHSLTSAVTAGEILNRRHLVENATVFELRRDILSEEVITSEDIITLTRGLPTTSSRQRFPARLLDDAVAARDLSAGQILSRSDLRVKHSVVTTTATLTRGQRLGAENTQMRTYYGKLPKDALLSMAEITQMEAIRTIRAGQLLRASDLKAADLIKKGDSVKLVVGNGMLKITVTVIALEGGRRDQQINLLNPESGERVRGVVSGPGQAKGL